jgi:hypothetical protein
MVKPKKVKLSNKRRSNKTRLNKRRSNKTRSNKRRSNKRQKGGNIFTNDVSNMHGVFNAIKGAGSPLKPTYLENTSFNTNY